MTLTKVNEAQPEKMRLHQLEQVRRMRRTSHPLAPLIKKNNGKFGHKVRGVHGWKSDLIIGT
jgi:hypothetical protein